MAAERVRADRRAQAQMREFANLTVELMAGRQVTKVQLEGMRIRVKVEKLENMMAASSATLIRGFSRYKNI